MAGQTRRPWQTAIGVPGLLIVTLGTVVIVAALGLLASFWAASMNAMDGANPPSSFLSSIITSGWAIRTVTVSSVFIRISMGVQGGLITAMLASVFLERNGARVSNLPMLSVMRSVNSHPIKLLQPLVQGPFGTLQVTCVSLATAAVLVALVSQFTSTILLLDFGNTLVLTAPTRASVPLGLEILGVNGILSSLQGVDYWNTRPAIYPRFAEMAGKPYEADGVQDTGLSFRSFVPFGSSTDREHLRSFNGLATVVDSRVICFRPHIDKPRVEVILPWMEKFYRTLTGNVVLGILGSRANLTTESIDWSSLSNCTFSLWDAAATAITNPNWRMSVCYVTLDGLAATISDGNVLAPDRIHLDLWSTYLVINVTGTDQDWPSTGVNLSDWTHSENHVWSSWTSADGSSSLSVSSCISNFLTEPHFYEVNISTSQQYQEPAAPWSASVGRYSMSKVTDLYCTHCNSKDGRSTEGDHGRLTLHLPSNWTSALADTEVVTGTYISLPFWGALLNGWWENQKWPGASSTALLAHDRFAVNQAHVDLFQSVLETTGNVAFAMQSLFTVLQQMAYYDWLPVFDSSSTVMTGFSTDVNISISWTGFTVVAAVLGMHLFVVLLSTVLFLTFTNRSLLGNAWPAVTQVLSVETERVVAEVCAQSEAANMTDKDVEEYLISTGRRNAVHRIGYRTSYGEPEGAWMLK
ncbi:hypothetical protein B0T19DRAFT_472836 [Cercophora scortea]|uniref:Uncharacterized protein n=1 Tax=Cercophora scortea TaxID=314031 RepID=A0AAE0MGY1_9PEZI|nr:hypothetical protein B0T19DRAFT_472836 [Cercophora scortea]